MEQVAELVCVFFNVEAGGGLERMPHRAGARGTMWHRMRFSRIMRVTTGDISVTIKCQVGSSKKRGTKELYQMYQLLYR